MRLGSRTVGVVMCLVVCMGAAGTATAQSDAPLGWKRHTFSNPTPITTSPGTTATPYPSQIVVSGAIKSVGIVEVRLYGISHPSPGNLDVLLRGPHGLMSVVMSDACANPLASKAFFFNGFREPYHPPLPQTDCSNASGSLRVTDYVTDTDSYPGAGDTSFVQASLSRFLGGFVHDGTWSLHVVDDGQPSGTASGAIGGGWSLDLLDCCYPIGPPPPPCDPAFTVPDQLGGVQFKFIDGTSEKDVLVGTSGRDVIRGLGGDDRIRGLGEADLLCGGPGDDRVSGGAGQDNLSGEAGSDLLRAGKGRNDGCDGGRGKDIAFGCTRRNTKSARLVRSKTALKSALRKLTK